MQKGKVHPCARPSRHGMTFNVLRRTAPPTLSRAVTRTHGRRHADLSSKHFADSYKRVLLYLFMINYGHGNFSFSIS